MNDDVVSFRLQPGTPLQVCQFHTGGKTVIAYRIANLGFNDLSINSGAGPLPLKAGETVDTTNVPGGGLTLSVTAPTSGYYRTLGVFESSK